MGKCSEASKSHTSRQGLTLVKGYVGTLGGKQWESSVVIYQQI